MQGRVRRNSGHAPTKSAAPYNELYETFSDVLSPIFVDRMPQGRRARIYVPVPDTEQAIESYLLADTNQVAILHGLMGSGKSTVLEHIHEIAPGNKKRYVFPLDFQGKRFHLMPKENFANLSRDERQAVLKSMVSSRINEVLTRFLKEHKAHINLNFFDYLMDNYPGEVTRKAVLADSNEEKMQALKEFMSDEDSTAPIQCFITYVTATLGIDEFVIYADNIDEQPFGIVEGIFFALSDLLVCLSRSNDAAATGQHPKGINKTRFRAMMACRSYTFESLTRDQEGILGTRGYHEIELNSASLLTKIVEKRITSAIEDAKVGNKSTTGKDAVYELRSGIPVHISGAHDFLEKFIKKLSQASVESRLFDLFNRNHARALKNLKYVVQNRYFISFDADVLSRGQIEADFEFTRVLKALCYGNPKQDSDLYYPAQSTVVTNLLWWDSSCPDGFLAILRVLQWLHAAGTTDHFGRIASHGRQILASMTHLEEHFGMQRETSERALKYCHDHGLLFSESGPGSGLSTSESVCCSPKGQMLLEQLFRDSVLFEAFVDDTCPPNGCDSLLEGRCEVVRFAKYPTRDHFLDALKWLENLRDAERQLLEDLKKRVPAAPRNHVTLFGGYLIAGRLGYALERTYETLYRHVCPKSDKAKLNDFLKSCSDSARYFGVIR